MMIKHITIKRKNITKTNKQYPHEYYNAWPHFMIRGLVFWFLFI